jgi:hypothetical protein
MRQDEPHSQRRNMQPANKPSETNDNAAAERSRRTIIKLTIASWVCLFVATLMVTAAILLNPPGKAEANAWVMIPAAPFGLGTVYLPIFTIIKIVRQVRKYRSPLKYLDLLVVSNVVVFLIPYLLGVLSWSR